MRNILKAILKWLLRILLVLFAVILLAISGFYIFNDAITRKAVEYINDQQPGEVYLGKLRLRPFMNFPDVSLKLNQLQYSTGHSGEAEQDSIPVLRFNEFYVSLDVIRLMRGEYRVSSVRLEDGVVNFLVYPDSVSNIEQALGIRFGNTSADTTSSDSSSLFLDMKSLKLTNVLMNYYDETTETAASAFVNEFESAFSYFPGMINAAVDLDVDVNRARSGDISLDRPRNMQLISSLNYDLLREEVTLDESTLKMRDTELMLSGNVYLVEKGELDLQFRARNEGIDLLNFLMSGVLDLDAIEQVGDGSIELYGEVKGGFANALPELKLNFNASDLGFYVRAIDQTVSDISFSGFATNGTKKDLSEARLRLDKFHATFPDGELNAEVGFANLVRPEIRLSMDGEADLALLNEIIKVDSLEGMRGNLTVSGDIDGVIDAGQGVFLDNAGELTMALENTAFSFGDYQVSELNGDFYVSEWNTGFRQMSLMLNRNRLNLDGQLTNLLPFLYGFSVNAAAMINLQADELSPGEITGDSSLMELFPEPIRDLGLKLTLRASNSELKRAMRESVMPEFDISMSRFGMTLPGYAPISDAKFLLQVKEDNIQLVNLKGEVGESSFKMNLSARNYHAFLASDSLKEIGVSFRLESPRMRAADLLTINNEFRVLPETYREEQLEDFVFSGELTTTVGELLKPEGLPDFRFSTEEMHWAFRYYPLEFKDFVVDIERKDSIIEVRQFDGSIGQSNFALKASVTHLLDTISGMKGSLDITSDLLDFNELLNYELLAAEETDTVVVPDSLSNAPPRLDQIDYPEFALNVNIGELRYAGNTLYGLEGKLRSMPYKMLYLDRFRIQSRTGGTVMLDGQFNVADAENYQLSAKFEIDTLNLSDFDVPFAVGDTAYSLEDNFTGKLDASGMAEVFVNEDLSVDLESTTAMLSFSLTDGSVKKFTPIQAAARYTGNKDLDNIRFGRLGPSTLTLVNKKIDIPLMKIESTLGLLLIEGKQSLEGDYLYLVRIPTALARQTAWNVIANRQDREDEEEDDIVKMRAQKFLMITPFSLGGESGIKAGNERDKLREEHNF